MFKVALKDILARKRRLVTTGLAIILGIAFLTGTQVLSGVLKNSIESLVGTAYVGFDAVVRSPDEQDLGFGQKLRSPVPESLANEVDQVSGVRNALGVVETTSAQLVGTNGKIVGSNFGPPTIVYNWLEDPQLQVGKLIEGRQPAALDEIVLDFSSAKDAGYKLGDQVTISAQTGSEKFSLVGLMGLGENGDLAGGAKMLHFTTPTAQRLGKLPEEFSYIAVAAEEGTSQATLANGLAAALPDEQIVTGEKFTRENQKSVSQFVDILTTFVSVFGYVALFVACFIIYNTFSILVAQRTKETALLRAIGAKRKQVLLAIVLEAVLVGLVASVLGLIGGVLLASVLKTLVGTFFTVQPGIPTLSAGAVATAFIVGVGVTVLSGLVPAWRSTKVPPIAALTDISVDRSSVSRARVIWGTLFLLGGIALLALGLADAGPNPLVLFGCGAVLFLVSVAVVLGPLIAAPFSRFLIWPFTRGSAITPRLAGENAARNPRRTAATAAALTIGVTLVTLIAVMASSIKASVESTVNSTISADFVINSSTFSIGTGIPTTAVVQARQVPGVQLASPVRFAPLRLTDEYSQKQAATKSGPAQANPFGAPDAAPPGEDTFVLGIEPQTYFKVNDVGTLQGSPKDMLPGTFGAELKEADKHGWKLGDKVPMYFARTGVQELELALTFDQGSGGGSYLLPLETFEANVLALFNTDFVVYVKAEPGADLAQVRTQLDAIVADSPAISVQDLGEFADAQTAPFDTFLAVVYGLLGLAVIIALIGIANTLSLSVLERTRELGLLRAVGMSRKQLRRTVIGESMIIAVLGTVIGLVIGIIFSFALSVVISADSPGLFKYTLPTGQLVIITIVAALAGVLAALAPAWRASRLDVLKAVSSV
ncbi:MAG: FtsX-like permease family protein [Microthrixaceae bacterium]